MVREVRVAFSERRVSAGIYLYTRNSIASAQEEKYIFLKFK